MTELSLESWKYDKDIDEKQKEMSDDYSLIDINKNQTALDERLKKLGIDEKNVEQGLEERDEYARLESEITPRKFTFGYSSILEDFPIPNFDSYAYTLKYGYYKHPQKVLDKLKEYPDIYKKYKETFPEVYDLLKEEGYDI